MRYHLTTFGCQMNDHDSERMKGLLESNGWSEAGVRDDADLILFNTCTIRGSADERFLGNLGDAKRVKRERPEAIVAVGGCWAQSQKEAVFRDFPFVDIAFGPGEVSRLGELVARERIEAVGAFSFDGAFSGSLPAKRERPHQAWVQISVGCNCVCAYCIVPSVRGRERSRPVADVVGEVAALAATGVLEVTLLGQNVNSYGRDLPREERATFAELLRAVAAVPGIAFSTRVLPDCAGRWRCSTTSGHSAIAAMTSAFMSFGCGDVYRTRAMPGTAATARSSSAKVARSSRGRSRPYEFTFWPSRVTSSTPVAASAATSPTTSATGRLRSRPRTFGTMQ